MANAASPFEPLHLSHHDANYLRELVHVFVQHQVESYERYLHDEHERLDKKQWKQVLQRDNTHVFSELQSSNPADYPGFVNQQQPVELADLPALLMVGQMEGSLDDAMYGVMTPSVASMRLKYFYSGDQLANGAVLTTIDRPSTTDPFQSLTVKWVEGYQSPMLRPLVSSRDFVYMEATGFTKLSDGELVAYHLLHSVHFPQTPKTRNNTRGTMSVCALYRQRNHSIVDLYCRASVNSGGRVARSIGVKYAAVSLISARKMVRCAHLKKLTWLLRARDAGNGDTIIRGEPKCIGCGQKPGIFATEIGSCSLCKRGLCSSCRHKIELGFASSNGSFFKKKFWFCTYCIDEAARTSSRAVACGEYADSRIAEPTPWSSGPTNSSSPSGSERSDDWGSLDKRYINLMPR